MVDVLKYTREDLGALVYHPIRPLDVVSEEIGIPVAEVQSVSLSKLRASPSHGHVRAISSHRSRCMHAFCDAADAELLETPAAKRMPVSPVRLPSWMRTRTCTRCRSS